MRRNIIGECDLSASKFPDSKENGAYIHHSVTRWCPTNGRNGAHLELQTSTLGIKYYDAILTIEYRFVSTLPSTVCRITS